MIAEFENYVKLNKKISPEVVGAVGQIDDYAKVADTVASHLAVKISEKQGSWRCRRSSSGWSACSA